MPPLTVFSLPSSLEHQVAAAATLFDDVLPPAVAFGAAAAMLAVALGLARRSPRLAVVLAAGAAFLLGLSTNGLVDDAYIQFRYAANLAAGHGPVFNPGERIEGASGGLWMALLGGAGAATTWDVASLGRFLSLLLAPVAVLAAAWAGGAAGAEAGALAAILWAAVPTTAMYAATGLETTAYALALLAMAGCALRGRRGGAAAAGLAIATLRPEGAFLAVAALPFVRRLPRAARAGVLATLAGGAAIALGRLAYYGLPFPRSALVKGVTAASGVTGGLAYLGNAALEWLPLLVALPLLGRFAGRLRAALVPAVAWTLLVVARGGDWMPGSRYLLPLLVTLVVAVAALAPRPRLFASAMVVWGLVLLLPLERPSPSPAGALYRSMNELRVQARWWESLGSWLARATPPGTRLASGPSGALPYASRLPTFDLYGLCSPVTAVRSGQAGHRLWGLADAVAGGTTLVYPGEMVPQTNDWAAVRRAAGIHVRDVPGFVERFEPIALAHAPEYHTDILVDVLWSRRDVPRPGARPGINPAH